MSSYLTITPISHRIPANRQGAKRHYGIHPYFTRRPFNVVREYILHYSKPGDTVLDPFGGSGVTAIEAFLENRTGLQNDINPMANFIADGLVELTNVTDADIHETLANIETNCRDRICDIHRARDIEARLAKHDGIKLPRNIRLPASSDVEHYFDLFTPRQLLSLAILKSEIDKIENKSLRHVFLLAWSSTLARLNKTFISTRGRAESRGGSSIFSIYRYKVAKQTIELHPWECFYNRFVNILRARGEMVRSIEMKNQTAGWIGQYRSYNYDVEELKDHFRESVDYIFTDPPYGGNISYLDLSILWNSWLGILPDKKTREKELIVGGELGFPEPHYIKRLYEGIKSSFAMLKYGRWLSVVFQHWNIDYFHAILSAARDSDAELKSAVLQIGDPIWSMHKKKGKESVLAGEFILTFLKKRGARERTPRRTISVEEIITRVLDEYVGDFIYGEYLLNRLVMEAWKYGIIEDLRIDKKDLADILNNYGWQYDDRKHYWYRPGVATGFLFRME